MLSSIWAVNFTNNTSRPGWTWYNYWKLLTINFKNKSFHNSVDWFELYLQLYITLWLAKILRFTVFRLLKNAFVELVLPYHDLVINPQCRTALHKFAPQNIVPHLRWKAFRKRPLHISWGKRLCSCSTWKSCGGMCSPDICKEVD